MLTVLIAPTYGLRPALRAVSAPRAAAVHLCAGSSAVETAEAELLDGLEKEPEAWVALAMRERYPVLRDISCSIRTRRTVDEAELALKLEEDFRADPSLFEDIDFSALIGRIRVDRQPENLQRISTVLNDEELAALEKRWDEASARLEALLPTYSNRTRDDAVGRTLPKIKRVIEKAREIPLTVELPSTSFEEGVDVGAVMRESKNVAVGLRNVWQRINGRGIKEEEMLALQKEAKALLQLRAETTKLRAGIRLVQRQKELKASLLVRFDGNDFLEQTLLADVSIARLEKELSLKVAFLELERIFLTVESELLASSSLVDQLLDVVERYGAMETSLRGMVSLAAEGRHSAIELQELGTLEADIGDVLLQLGLQADEQAPFSWARTKETASVNLNKALQGVYFYGRGTQLIGQDLQLAGAMLVRAVLQGYTLRTREVRLLRRILKDLITLVPFIIILIIPLSPLGHVLVFSFIQRFFPDFFPSAFTESRQQLMSMYSSITTPTEAGVAEAVGSVVPLQTDERAAELQAADEAAAAAAARAVAAEEELRAVRGALAAELGAEPLSDERKPDE